MRLPLLLLAATFSLGASATSLTGCGPSHGRPAVSMKMSVAAGSPGDATVTIDEEYVGPLSYVASHGVRLPVGEHRITVEKEGYFPWDKLVEADRQPIHLDIKLVPVPD